ncbi:MAG: hypothetical protein AAB774_00880 [Patescibacteria group bacterium]
MFNLFSLSKTRKVQTVAIVGSLLAITAIVIGVIRFQAAEKVPIEIPSPPLFEVLFLAQIPNGVKTLEGAVQIAGDCLDEKTQAEFSSRINYGRAYCQLIKTNSGARHTPEDDKTFFIDSISFFNDDTQILYTIPITGERSRSPLRLTGNSRLEVTFMKNGEITTSLETLPTIP